MSHLAILITSLIFGVTGFGIVALAVFRPLSQRLALTARQQMVALVALHLFRYGGLAFLLVGVTAPPGIAPDFAGWLAYGDVVSMLLAYIAFGALQRPSGLTIPLLWIFNLVGFADLLNGLVQGLLRSFEPALFGATFLIFAFYVPALIVSHLLLFRVLLGRGIRQALQTA